jgi:hypothetical protein
MIEVDRIFIEIDSSNRFESIRFQLCMDPVSLFFALLIMSIPPLLVALACRSRAQETLPVLSLFLACPCLYEVLLLILSLVCLVRSKETLPLSSLLLGEILGKQVA